MKESSEFWVDLQWCGAQPYVWAWYVGGSTPCPPDMPNSYKCPQIILSLLLLFVVVLPIMS